MTLGESEDVWMRTAVEVDTVLPVVGLLWEHKD